MSYEFKTGEFWADEESPREHCYEIVPLFDNKPKGVTNKDFGIAYNILVNWGIVLEMLDIPQAKW